MEYYWELRSKNAQNIKTLMCPLQDHFLIFLYNHGSTYLQTRLNCVHGEQYFLLVVVKTVRFLLIDFKQESQ